MASPEATEKAVAAVRMWAAARAISVVNRLGARGDSILISKDALRDLLSNELANATLRGVVNGITVERAQPARGVQIEVEVVSRDGRPTNPDGTFR